MSETIPAEPPVEYEWATMTPAGNPVKWRSELEARGINDATKHPLMRRTVGPWMPVEDNEGSDTL